MSFSFRNTLASFILMGLVILVAHQTFVQHQQNKIPLQEALLSNINPFPQSPTIPEISDFSMNFPIPIENKTDTEIIPNGKISLYETNGKQIQDVGVFSGALNDYLSINPHHDAIEKNSTKIFDVQWNGFGERYIENGTVKINFLSPVEYYGDIENTSLSFWEKFIPTTQSHEILVKTEITTSENGEKIEDEQKITLHYPGIIKTINIGLIVDFGIIIALLLILWKSVSTPKYTYKEKNNSSSLHRELEEFEKSAKEMLEKSSEIPSKTLKKIPKSQAPKRKNKKPK